MFNLLHKSVSCTYKSKALLWFVNPNLTSIPSLTKTPSSSEYHIFSVYLLSFCYHFFLPSISTSFPNLFRFVLSYRIWNWLVKRRHVFTEDFTIQGWFHFICYQDCLSLCMLKIWGVCAHKWMCVLLYGLCLPFSQLYICHTISLSIHGYIWHMLNRFQGDRLKQCALR